RRCPSVTLFPYTTLFRSPASRRLERCRVFRAAQPGRRALSARVNFAVCPVRTAWSKESEMEQQTVKIGAKQAEVPDARGYYGERSEEHTSELQSRENLVC